MNDKRVKLLCAKYLKTLYTDEKLENILQTSATDKNHLHSIFFYYMTDSQVQFLELQILRLHYLDRYAEPINYLVEPLIIFRNRCSIPLLTMFIRELISSVFIPPARTILI